MGKRVNQRELSEIMGVSDVMLWEWEKAGMPIVARGDRGAAHEFDTAAVIEWRMELEVQRRTPAKVKEEKERVELELAQLTLGERKGSLVPAAEVDPVWQNRVMSAAAFMHGRHSRLAGILEATPGLEAKREVLKKEDAQFLTKLGVDGDRVQEEFNALLARLAADEAQAFLRRISGDEHSPGTQGSADPGLEGPDSA